MNTLYPWLVPFYQKITDAFLDGFGHHALLFKADEGVGAERLVEEVARFLICQNTDKPCGICHACQLFNAHNHSDFYLLTSIDGKEMGVDQVREITEKLHQHAQLGGNKVVWVQGAEKMTEAAANALLKTLEEPRPHTYFLLQAQICKPLLPTISSRCQQWRIPVPSQEESIEWLKPFAPKIEEILPSLQMNGFRPLSALAFMEQNYLAQRTAFLRQFWLFYSRLSPLELLPLFEKDQLNAQLSWIEAFLMDCFKCKLGIQTHWQCQDIANGVIKFAEQNSRQGILHCLKIWQQLRQDLTITGVNQELMLLNALTCLISEVFSPNITK